MPTDYNSVKANVKEVSSSGPDQVEERKKKDPVVSKVVKIQKKGLMERLVIGVLGPDGLPSIGRYLGHEVILPAVKNIVVDMVTSGVNMAMYGQEGRRGPKPPVNYSGPSTNHWSKPPSTNYANRYQSQSPSFTNPPATYATPSTRRVGGNFVDEYIIADRNEALMALDSLVSTAREYGVVAVADYLDLIGIDAQFTDNTYGWTYDALSQAAVRPTNSGFILKLPPVSVI